jgi:hypothetical protein
MELIDCNGCVDDVLASANADFQMYLQSTSIKNCVSWPCAVPVFRASHIFAPYVLRALALHYFKHQMLCLQHYCGILHPS